MKRFAFLPALAVAFTVACQDAPTAVQSPVQPRLAAATTTTVSQTFPIALSVSIPCANESVLLTGELHDLYHITINGKNVSLKYHDNPQGVTGTGSVSGDKYQATGVTQGQQGGTLVDGKFEMSMINNFRIIGQGSGNNYLVHENFHVTVTANGDVTAQHDNFSVECK